MAKPNPFSTRPLSTLSRFLLQHSPAAVAAVTTSMVFGLLALTIGIIYIFSDQSTPGSIWLLVLLALTIPGIAGYIAAYSVIRSQRSVLDRALGRALTGADRIALATWYKTGRRPAAAHLQPVLPAYVTRMEKIIDGTASPYSSGYVRVMLIGYGLMIINAIFQLVIDPRAYAYYFILVGLSVASLMIWLSHSVRPQPAFIKRLNGRARARLAAMRAQL